MARTTTRKPRTRRPPLADVFANLECHDWHMGGGCRAYGRYDGETEILITYAEAPWLPEKWSDPLAIGFYDAVEPADGITFEYPTVATWFDMGAAAERAAADSWERERAKSRSANWGFRVIDDAAVLALAAQLRWPLADVFVLQAVLEAGGSASAAVFADHAVVTLVAPSGELPPTLRGAFPLSARRIAFVRRFAA